MDCTPRPASFVRLVVLCGLLIAQLAFLPLLSTSAQSTPEASPVVEPAAELTPYAWVQVGPDGVLSARVIVDGDCPALIADDQSLPMTSRAPAASEAFPVSICEATVPEGATALTVSGQPLPAMSDQPRRIAIIGDTGCRAETGDPFQSCNDPIAWPFATIAGQVAAFEPDLIIHVGDYLYREVACPDDNPGCAGSPYGDNWATWEADFFRPASAALPAAPWLFIRGNHETCSRAGEGWFHFLDPHAYPDACLDYTDPYAFDVGAQRLVVLDSAIAADETSTPEETEMFRQEFLDLAELTGDSAWLVTHKPIWGIIENKKGIQIEVDTETFADAIDDVLPESITVVFSGHIHLAQILDFNNGSGRPIQFVVGNSGTELDRNITASLTGMELDDKVLSYAETIERFGFMTLEPVDAGWVATERGVDGSTGISCLILGKGATCGMAHSD
ncbi:MAG: metallophosphoesterase [Chloroflexota bacterium]|nr:metallophosphoesterase [Chloroflexota bacterium]